VNTEANKYERKITTRVNQRNSSLLPGGIFPPPYFAAKPFT